MCLKRSRSRNSTASIWPASLARVDGLRQVGLQEHAVRQAGEVIVIRELVEALLVREQLCLGAFALGQVAHQERDEVAAMRQHRHVAHIDFQHAAVLADLLQLVAATRHDVLQQHGHRVGIAARPAQHRFQRQRTQLPDFVTQLFQRGRIGVDDLAAGTVGDDDAVLGLLEDGLVARGERLPLILVPLLATRQQRGRGGEHDKQ